MFLLRRIIHLSFSECCLTLWRCCDVCWIFKKVPSCRRTTNFPEHVDLWTKKHFSADPSLALFISHEIFVLCRNDLESEIWTTPVHAGMQLKLLSWTNASRFFPPTTVQQTDSHFSWRNKRFFRTIPPRNCWNLPFPRTSLQTKLETLALSVFLPGVAIKVVCIQLREHNKREIYVKMTRSAFDKHRLTQIQWHLCTVDRRKCREIKKISIVWGKSLNPLFSFSAAF